MAILRITLKILFLCRMDVRDFEILSDVIKGPIHENHQRVSSVVRVVVSGLYLQDVITYHGMFLAKGNSETTGRQNNLLTHGIQFFIVYCINKISLVMLELLFVMVGFTATGIAVPDEDASLIWVFTSS